jgi:dipeptidyl aminopeptidase/acylaminoacyl peptidase
MMAHSLTLTRGTTLLLAVLLMIACGHVQPKPEPPSPTCPPDDGLPNMDQYMKILSTERPQVAPDDRVYFISWDTGVNQIYRADTPPTAITQAQDFPEGLDFFTLSPDGRYLIVEADVGGDEQFDLYLIDLASDALAVQPFDVDRAVRADSVVFSPDSSSIVYRCNRRNGRDFDIWRSSISGKPELWIQTEGYLWLSDISPDGSQLAFSRYYGGDQADLFIADLETRSVRALTHVPPETGGVFGGAHFSADGKHLYLITNSGQERSTLARIDAQSGEWSLLLTSDWEVEGLAMSPDRLQLAYLLNEGGYSHAYVSPTDAFAPTRLDHPELAIVSALEFGVRDLVVLGASATRTSDVYRLPLSGGAPVQVTVSDYAGIDTAHFVEPELVEYTSFDGLSIPAFLYKPTGQAAPAAYLIYAHGGPEAQFRPGFVRNFQYLLSKGIGIIAPNVRGSSGYTRQFLELDDYKKRMDSVRDYKAAADWLVAQGLADPKKLGIMGGSYGGFVVMACITEYPELFAAAIDKVGIVNFITYFENTKGYRRSVREKEYGPADDVEFLRSISPILKIDQVVTPLMVVHGENDPRVPVGEARQIIQALEAKGQVVEAIIFPDEGHGVDKLENRLFVYDKMSEFLIIHLLGTPPACLNR